MLSGSQICDVLACFIGIVLDSCCPTLPLTCDVRFDNPDQLSFAASTMCPTLASSRDILVHPSNLIFMR